MAVGGCYVLKAEIVAGYPLGFYRGMAWLKGFRSSETTDRYAKVIWGV
jgi:hypothetical protein